MFARSSLFRQKFVTSLIIKLRLLTKLAPRLARPRSNNEFSGNVKKAYSLTFNQGGMSSFMLDFSDRYQRIKVPSEFPRGTRALCAAGDLKASEWRIIAIIAFVALNDVFDQDDILDDNSAKSQKIRDLRFFWLLTVK